MTPRSAQLRLGTSAVKGKDSVPDTELDALSVSRILTVPWARTEERSTTTLLPEAVGWLVVYLAVLLPLT